jgi:hypothetical protein
MTEVAAGDSHDRCLLRRFCHSLPLGSPPRPQRLLPSRPRPADRTALQPVDDPRPLQSARAAPGREPRLAAGARPRGSLPPRRALLDHDAARDRHRSTRLRLLRSLLPARRTRPGPVRRHLHGLRRHDVRSRHRRRAAHALPVLGRHHRLLLPAHRPQPITTPLPPGGSAGADRHHRRRPGHARGHGPAHHRHGHRTHLGAGRPRPAGHGHRSGHHLRDHPHPHRRDLEVRAHALPLLAAGRDGRPHPGQCLPSRRGHGQGRNLPGAASGAGLQQPSRLVGGAADAGPADHVHRRLAGPEADRPQTVAGLRHGLPAGLPHHHGLLRHPRHHESGAGPAHRPRPVQVLPVPVCGHHRPPRRHPRPDEALRRLEGVPRRGRRARRSRPPRWRGCPRCSASSRRKPCTRPC